MSGTKANLAALALLVLALSSSAGAADQPSGFPVALPCSASQYYDSTTLLCLSCDGVGTRPNDARTGCVCMPGYRVDAARSTAASSGPTCVACSGGAPASSLDRTVCMACDTSTSTLRRSLLQNGTQDANTTLTSTPAAAAATAAFFNNATQDCACLDKFSIVVEKDSAGNYLAAKRCLKCPAGQYVLASDPYRCNKCPDSSMVYDAANDRCTCIGEKSITAGRYCFSEADLRSRGLQIPSASSYSISYSVLNEQGGTSPVTIASTFFQDNLLPSQFFCRDKSAEFCQQLANQCAFLNYESTQGKACAALTALGVNLSPGKFPGQRLGLPWIAYETVDSASILRATDIKLRVSFAADKQYASSLSFVLAQYHPNGTFLGFVPLGDQLQLCGSPLGRSTTDFLRFGVNSEISCRVSLPELFNATAPPLYDAYLVDSDGSLYPVPVRLLNARPAAGTPEPLYRRFFLLDVTSGRSKATGQPDAIRFAQSITLSVTLAEGVERGIYPPTLSIRYADAQYSRLAAVASAEVRFVAEYVSSQDSFWYAARIMLIVGCVLVGLLWIASVYFFQRRRQNAEFDWQLLARILIYLCSIGADFFFWLLFVLCAYWWIFYKGQSAVFVMLPTESQARDIFMLFLLMALVGKVIRVAFVVYQQCNIDIFFIDWEKSRGRLQGKGTEAGPLAPVSMWRSIFAANEFAEIQNIRGTNLEMTLVMVLLIMGGLSVNGAAARRPGIDAAGGETSPILRFVVAAFWWLALALVQYVWKSVIYRRYFVDETGQYIDLLSVSNISCLILTSQYHGYYLHGRSVHPFADTNMKEMNAQLRREEENMVGSRGLVPDDPTACQSFEVYVTKKLREKIDQVYFATLRTEAASKAQQTGRLGRLAGSAGVPSETLVKAYQKLNKDLVAFIDEFQSLHRSQIREKTLFEKLLPVPPEMELTKDPIFYFDRGQSWRRTIFEGAEYDLLILNILVYTVIDFATTNTPVAVVVTYFVEWALNYLRDHFGTRNIARKALIDEKFLV
eukprot:tig00021319_g20224.t1